MMNRLHVKYLLAGAGIASSAAAEAIRERDPDGSILMIGQEIIRPYNRAALSRQFLPKKISRADLNLHPPEWFEERNIQLRTGRRVAHLDTARSSASLDDGNEISYDAMLLAVGASAKLLRISGADLPGIYYLRTLADAERVQNAIDVALRSGRRHARGVGRGRATVIGSELVGVEFAVSLVARGLHVDLIVPHAHPWAHYVGDITGAFITKNLEQHGVFIHRNVRADHFEGDGRMQRVVLSNDESIESDLVIAAVGVTINRELLRDTPINAETSVLVDDHCRSNVVNIFAAGDCAALFDSRFGKYVWSDHWENAAVSGKIAGTNMSGGDARFDFVTHFFSELFDLTIDVWGERRPIVRRLIRPGNGAAFIEFGIASDGRIAQIVRVGECESQRLLQRLVAQRAQINGREEELKDPARPIEMYFGTADERR